MADKKQNPQSPGPMSTAPLHCLKQGCKKPDQRFGFCMEHYDFFKFGLIKKNGENAADYDKKIDHFMRMKEREKKAA